MDNRIYRKLTEKQIEGARVQSTVKLSNGWCQIQAGTLFTVTGKHVGLSLISDPCSTCGVQVRITKVPPQAINLLLLKTDIG